jgi:hypothetical protein
MVLETTPSVLGCYIWSRAVSQSKPALPRTMHYRGEGRFMVSGTAKNMRSMFKKEYLES